MRTHIHDSAPIFMLIHVKKTREG